MVSVCPAIVTVPVRAVAPVFGAIVRPTGPVLVPLAPDVTVIHESLLTAVQEQPAPATLTLTIGDSPAETAALLSGATV
jgi:hypothetical protein